MPIFVVYVEKRFLFEHFSLNRHLLLHKRTFCCVTVATGPCAAVRQSVRAPCLRFPFCSGVVHWVHHADSFYSPALKRSGLWCSLCGVTRRQCDLTDSLTPAHCWYSETKKINKSAFMEVMLVIWCFTWKSASSITCFTSVPKCCSQYTFSMRNDFLFYL